MRRPYRPMGRCRRFGLPGLGLAAAIATWGIAQVPGRAGEGGGAEAGSVAPAAVSAAVVVGDPPDPAGAPAVAGPLATPPPRPFSTSPARPPVPDPAAAGSHAPPEPGAMLGRPGDGTPGERPAARAAVPPEPAGRSRPIDPDEPAGATGPADEPRPPGTPGTTAPDDAPAPAVPAPDGPIDRPGRPDDALKVVVQGEPGPPPPPAQPAPFVLPAPLPGAGVRVTLRVQDQDIRRALELLGSQADVNILASPAVGGVVSVNLQDVTFDQALDVLLRLGDLVARREGDILYVYTAEEAQQMAARQREPIVKVYHLNYVRAFDVAVMIQPFLSEQGTLSLTPPSQQGISSRAAGTRGGGVGLAGGLGGALAAPVGGAAVGGGALASGPFASAGASVSGAGATGGNSFAVSDMVVVRDFPENIEVIDQIIARLDVQPLQVLIEAVIISVELRDNQQLGVNFALVDNLATEAVVSGSGALINAAAGFSPAKVLSAAGPPPAPPGLGGYVGDRPGQLLPGYLQDQGLKYGFVSNNVSGFIRALETLNKINILASPRVLVLNKQLAEIQLGQRLGFRNTVTNLTSSLQTVEFLSVGTLLALRPFVSQDGMIRMEIHPERSNGFLDNQGIPQTNTSELTTNILVPDGATIVIGGLIDSTDEITQEGVLGLSRLPLVGPLFRSRLMGARKQELIVLLTPRILGRDGLPGPVPGVAPHGPSGVPNSGPMPGPPRALDLAAAAPGAAADLDPLRLTRLLAAGGAADLDPGRRLRALLSSGFDTSGLKIPDIPPRPATAPAMPVAAGARAAPTRDGAIRPASGTAADVASAPSAATATPSPPAAAVAERARDGRGGYRPGDLTRAVVGRLAHRFDRDAARDPAAADMPPPPQAAPAADTGVVRTGITQHVVAEGEDFRSIARRYYGTPVLHAALWAVNRHHIAAEEELRPGMTLLVPPAEVLERVYVEAVETATRLRDAASPAPPEPPRRRWLDRLRR